MLDQSGEFGAFLPTPGHVEKYRLGMSQILGIWSNAVEEKKKPDSEGNSLNGRINNCEPTIRKNHLDINIISRNGGEKTLV